MKKITKLVVLVGLIVNYSFAQVGIGTTTPNASIDIVASNQATPSSTDGLLLPRIDEFPIISPGVNQDGMLVYATGNGTVTKGFYFWNHTISSWELINGTAITRINDLLDGKSDNDGTNDGSSIFLGVDAGILDDSSDNKNIAVGFQALQNSSVGENNIAIGYQAGRLQAGSRNVFIGTEAGRGAIPHNTSGNVFIGYQAGIAEMANNKLIIEGSSGVPLIYGEFDNDILRVNGELQAGDPLGSGYAFPSIDGLPNQLLQTDGNGQLSFVTSSITEDADWFQVGTTSPPTDNTDNIFTMGKVAIGKNTATAYLDIEHSQATGYGLSITSTGTDVGNKYHIYNDVASNASGSQYAMSNNFSANSSGNKYGVYNNFGTVLGNKYGLYNNFSGVASGTIYGSYNRIANTTSSLKFGSYNLLTGFTGGAYGAYYTLTPSASSSATLYGVYSRVSSTGTGMHYGIYADAYGDNNRAIYGYNTHPSGYAGYFQGRGYFGGDLGVGVVDPVYRLDVYDVVYDDYVTQIYNRNTSTVAKGVKIKLGNTAPTNTNYYIGFFDGADGVNGRIQGTSIGVSYQTLSDKRLKTNFEKVNGALEMLNKIEPTIYEFKELKGKKEMGFLAQDLQLVFPQAVSGTPNSDVNKEPMMVDYSRLTPLLTAGIKELNEKVERLSDENKLLKAQLLQYKQLEKRIQVLEH